MLINELLRTCAHRTVATAAVSGIGLRFFADVEHAGGLAGLTVGEYVAMTVVRFARTSGEAEVRSVASAMAGSQEPILAGLRRLLCIMLAADCESNERQVRERLPYIPPRTCTMEFEVPREYLR